MLKGKEEEIKKLELDSLTEKAKKAVLLRNSVIALAILLTALIGAILAANKGYVELKLARANDLIYKQEFDSANDILHPHNVFSLLNFLSQDDIDNLGRLATTQQELKNKFYAVILTGDSLLKISDSLFNNVNVLVEKNINSNEKLSDTDVEKIIKAIASVKVKEAWASYDSALNMNYKPKNEIEAVEIDHKMTKANDDIQKIFGQYIDVTYFLLQNKYKEKAKLAYDKAKSLQSFAMENYITIDSVNLHDSDNLRKILN